MKCILMLLGVLALAASETFDTRYDNVDVQKLFNNTEMLQGYLDCFLDRAPCDEAPKHFKLTLAEAIQQACAKCSEAQKNIARTFLAALQEKIPNGLIDFKNKYDPEDKYFKVLQESIAKGQ